MADWSAILGTASSAIGGIFSYLANQETNDKNVAMTRETNEQNKMLADKQMAFQAEQLREQQQFASEEAQKARGWDSPVEQLKRYQEAGINPFVAFSGNLSNVSSAQASAPTSGVSPSMPTMIPAMRQMPFNLASGVSDAFLKTAQAIKQIKDSRLAETQKKEIDSMLQDRIAQLKATTEGQELANSLSQLYAEPKAKAELALLGKQALLAAQQGNTEIYEQALKDSETRLNQILSKVHGQDYELKKKQNDTYMQELRARVDNLYSQSYRNRQEGAYLGEKIKSEPEVRQKFINEALGAYEQYLGYNLDNAQKAKVREIIEKELIVDVAQKVKNFYNPFMYVGGLLSGAAGASLRAIAK